MTIQKYSYPNESFSGCDMVATILMPSLKDDGSKNVYTIGELQTISYSIHMDRMPIRSVGNINAKDYVMGPRTIAGSLVFAVFNKHFSKNILDNAKNEFDNGYSFLIDELPPFDIVLSLANEYGLRSKIVIYGVRLINEGQVMSVNDIYTENTYQFIATDLDYLDDENSYSSSGEKWHDRYIIDSSTSRRTMADSRANSIFSNNDNSIELLYNKLSPANQYNMGLIEFTLIPKQKNGYIEISRINANGKLKIYLSNIRDNSAVKVQLSAGEYTAVWTDNKDKSNEVSFSIDYKEMTKRTISPPPLIENITESSVTVSPNVQYHTKVIYRDEEGNEMVQSIKGRTAILTSLKSSTVYSISSCNEDRTEISNMVNAKTLAFGFDLFQDFLQFLSYSRTSLKNNNFTVYTNVIYKAKDEHYASPQKTLTDSIISAKKYYTSKLEGLNKEDFATESDFIIEQERLKELINCSTEVIVISNKVTNDKVYGYNKDFIVVEQPYLECEDFCTDTFIIDKDVNSMQIFRKKNESVQYDKKIGSNSFKQEESYNKCIYTGRQNNNYYTYAYNKFGFRSPRIDFTVLSDLEKEYAISKRDEEIKYQKYLLKKEETNNPEILNSNLSNQDIETVLYEFAKKPIVNTVKAPVIIVNNSSEVIVEVQEELNMLKLNECRLVISEIEDSLNNSIKYKKVITSKETTFSSYEYGLKDNKRYSLWIEDAEENQISECVNIIYANNISSVKEYILENNTKALKNDLKNKNIYDDTIGSIITSNCSYEDSNKSNIFSNILDDILSNSNIFYNIIYNILYIMIHEIERFDVSEELIEEVEYSKNSNSIKRVNGFKAIVYEMDHNGVNIRLDDSNTDTIELKNCLYNAVTFVSDDLSKRTGFLLIENRSKNVMAYKIAVKEVQ